MAVLEYDPKNPLEHASTVAYKMLLEYSKDYPGITPEQKRGFYNDAVSAAKTVLEYEGNISLDKAIKLTEQYEAFADKYRCGVIEFSTSITAINLPKCISKLSPSYAQKKAPEFKEPTEVKTITFCDKKIPKHKITPILSENPEEIEAILKKDNPSAYKVFEYQCEMANRANITKGQMLRVIAKMTRDLNGIEISEGCSGMFYKDPLATIISGMSTEYQSEQTLPFVMETSVKLAKRNKEITLYDITEFATDCFGFGYDVGYHYPGGELNIQRDPDIVNILADFYVNLSEDRQRKISSLSKHLARIYIGIELDSETKDKKETFKKSLKEFEKYIEDLEALQKDLIGSFGMKILLRALDTCTPEDIQEKSKLVLSFIKTLRDRGEKQLDKVLMAFEWYGSKLTPYLMDKILKLHEHFGILQFNRFQKDKGDFSLIDELLKNTDPAYNSDKPLAVVAMPREGSSFIFDTFAMGNFYEFLKDIAKGHKLLVYSVAEENGLSNASKTAQNIGGKAIDLLILAGHGGQFYMNFGSSGWEALQKPEDRVRGNGAINYGDNTEKQILDITDVDAIKGMEVYLTAGAPIILLGCLTGKGRAREVNLANTIAFNLPGHVVYASDNVTEGIKLTTDESGKIKDIKLLRPEDPKYGETRTYAVIKPTP